MPGENANPRATTGWWPASASAITLSSLFEPVASGSSESVFSSQTRPSSIAAVRPALAASLNDLSPMPPMSYATPTLRSALHSGAAVPSPGPAGSSPQAAATSASTARGTRSIQNHFAMLPPSLNLLRAEQPDRTDSPGGERVRQTRHAQTPWETTEPEVARDG